MLNLNERNIYMSSDDLPDEFRSLYAVGESLGKDIRNHLDTRPSKGSDYLRVDLPSDVTARIFDGRVLKKMNY